MTRRTPRETFLADQHQAATADTEHIVRDAARAAGRALTEIDADAATDLGRDPLTARAVAIFVGMHRRRGFMSDCGHLAGAPAPRWWSSALPNKIWCGRGGCTMLAVNFVLQAHGILPTVCAVCFGPESKPRLEVALDDVRLVLEVCLPCLRRFSPGGSS